MNSAEVFRHKDSGKDMNIDFYPNVKIFSGQEHLNIRGDFTVDGLDKMLDVARETFFFNEETAQKLGLDKYLLQNSHFTLREDWFAGRTDSLQGVYFGELALSIDNGAVVVLPIAIKPYWRQNQNLAIHEYVAQLHFSKNKNIRSFNPIGFWMDADGKPTLLTIFEEPVMSLDNVEWNKPGQMAFGVDDDLTVALKKSARTLGSLHANGYAHRDAQIKNMAVDVRSWATRLIDLTRLRRIHTVADLRPIEWQQAVYDDLSTLVKSLERAGYFETPKANSLRVLDLGFLALHQSLISHPSAISKLFKGADEVNKEIHDEIRKII